MAKTATKEYAYECDGCRSRVFCTANALLKVEHWHRERGVFTKGERIGERWVLILCPSCYKGP